MSQMLLKNKKGRRKGRQERKEKRKEGSFHNQLLKIANESKTALGCWPFVKSFQSWRFLGPGTVV